MQNYFTRRFLGVFFTGLFLSIFVSGVFAQNMFRKVNDFDGDGKADFAVTRHDGAFKYWWIWQTTAGVKVVQWGLSNEVNASGDYDGDGKTDFAVWGGGPSSDRTSFRILESQTNTVSQKLFVHFIDSSPLQQDYNGDGKMDAATITGEANRTLCVVYSGSDSGFCRNTFDNAIRIGDMDGDGNAESSRYRFDNNFQRQAVTITNLTTNAQRFILFGLPNDQYQMADFDGDGTGDLTVYRPSDGNWWWMRSSDNVISAANWGVSGDKPVPADYDGDGKTDLAIYRPGTAQSPQSYFWVYGSMSGASVLAWGISTDTAVTY